MPATTTAPAQSPAAPLLPHCLPLTCRCTGGGLDRATAADLVADVQRTSEGVMARLSVVLPDHARCPLDKHLTLWLSSWELRALLLQLAELDDLQAAG